jgi:hypothetical protein
MAAYVDYDYYTDTYLGSAIAEAAFDALALRASATIDRLTFDRAAEVIDADDDADTIDLIQMATCAVAEELQTQASETGIVQSETVGRHSVTYVQGSVQSLKKRQSEAAALYLAGTGLLYRGFASGEYGTSIDEDTA